MAPRSLFPAIVAFYCTHRRIPTYREIMRLAGFRSTNAAAKLVKKLHTHHLIQQNSAGRLAQPILFRVLPLGHCVAGCPLASRRGPPLSFRPLGEISAFP